MSKQEKKKTKHLNFPLFCCENDSSISYLKIQSRLIIEFKYTLSFRQARHLLCTRTDKFQNSFSTVEVNVRYILVKGRSNGLVWSVAFFTHTPFPISTPPGQGSVMKQTVQQGDESSCLQENILSTKPQQSVKALIQDPLQIGLGNYGLNTQLIHVSNFPIYISKRIIDS